jgi:type I restriction enzyme S subunit
MNEWNKSRLGEVARIEIGGTPSRNDSSLWASENAVGYPWVAISDLRRRYVSTTSEYITKKGIHRSNVKLVPSGTVLMSFKLTIGRVAIAATRLYTNEAIAAFFNDSSRIDSSFLYYVLPDAATTAITDTAIKGATLNKTSLRELQVSLPPLPEQRKIASILTTVDNLIEQTEALIEKYKSIKQGMMHDLFTRGVDQSGRLRPPYEDAPELYKESELGWIPKEWEAAVLGEEIGEITSGWSPICDAEIAAEGEWAILKTTAVVWDGYDDGENKRLPYHLQPLPKIEVVKDDILITRKGPVERVGVVVHVPETRSHMMIPDTVFRVRIENSSELSPAFVPLALGCEQVQTDWFGRKIGLADAQVNVNHGILRSTILPKPNQDEQTAICTRMRAIQDTIDAEQAHVDDLASLKTGLMQDLLTGKVRVNVDETEEVTANV